MMALAECDHGVSNQAQGYGKLWQPTQLLAELEEKFVAWAIHPSAIDCCRFISGNFPELGKPAEVVEADEVASLRGPAQALHPQAIAGCAHGLPVVEWIAPALSGGAEIIGRDARDDFRLKVIFFQPEQVAVRPYIGAVVIHENGDVADDTNGLFRAVVTQRVPLLPEEKLHNSPCRKLGTQVAPCRFESSLLAASQPRWPPVPMFSMAPAKGVE